MKILKKISCLIIMFIFLLSGSIVNADEADNVSSETELKSAISNQSISTINLNNDIELSEVLIIGKNLKINGNGHKLTLGKNNIGRHMRINEGFKITSDRIVP